MKEGARSRGRLTVERRASDGAMVASELRATYPLRLHVMPDQQEVYSIDKKRKALCCYLLGYGGGLVSGDSIFLDVTVKKEASLVVTSQSTSKAFRARMDRPDAELRSDARILPGGLLVWAPQPTQCFRGSRVKQSTNVTMATDSSLLLLDWYTGGRRNLDSGGWQMESKETVTTVSYEGTNGTTRFFRDASILSGGVGLQRHMRHFQVVAAVVLVGPLVKDVADRLVEEYASRNSYSFDPDQGDGLNRDGFIVSCGMFRTVHGQPDGVLLRIASESVEQAALFLSKHVGTLNDQLSDDPFMEILVSRCGANRSQAGSERPVNENARRRELSINMIRQSLPRREYDEEIQTSDPGYAKAEMAAIRPSTLYQLVDSSAPTGGFAHSNTLEAAVQLQLVDASSLQEYTFDVLLQTLTSQVPFLLRACFLFHELREGISEDSLVPISHEVRHVVELWAKLDLELAVNTTSQVASRASRLQGSGTLRAFSRVFPHIEPILSLIRKCALKGSGGHGATSFGAICGLVGVDPAMSASMFCYTTARDMINAAVRMNILGPLEGGRIINALCRKIDDIMDKHMEATAGQATRWIPPASAHQTAPLVEVLANAHDRLYTRLFNS